MRCINASSDAERQDAFEVRRKVYWEEEGLVADDGATTASHVDELDGLATTEHFVVYSDDEPIAASRVLFANEDVARAKGGVFGIDLETKYDLTPVWQNRMGFAEVTRLAVLKEYRSKGAFLLLCSEMRKACERRGVSHWLAGASMQSDHAPDADVAYSLAVQKGLTSSLWRVSPVGKPRAGRGVRKPLYDAETRAKARRGDFSGIDLPSRLELFAVRMGARVLGAPVYDNRFGVYSMPIVLGLENVRVAHG